MNIAKQRDFLLKENVGTPLDEMAKISGDLKTAIEDVIKSSPELDGLALKKAIKADASVVTALGEDSLYDNQLNKFIASIKSGKTTGNRNSGGAVTAAKDDMNNMGGNSSETSLNKLLSDPTDDLEGDLDIDDTWNSADEDEDDEKGPTSKDIDNTFTNDVTDAGDLNHWKNIIVKKVAKLEALPLKDRSQSPDMYSLKQILQKPEVKKLGADVVRSLVSPIMG